MGHVGSFLEEGLDDVLDFMNVPTKNEKEGLLSNKYNQRFTMNERYLFFWTKSAIDYYDLHKELIPKNKKTIDFRISQL